MNTKTLFAPNIDRQGRLLRGMVGLVLLVGAAFGVRESGWLGALLAAGGIFSVFEALRGWCAARSCGLKTRL